MDSYEEIRLVGYVNSQDGTVHPQEFLKKLQNLMEEYKIDMLNIGWANQGQGSRCNVSWQ
jgi:hypothetical protein